MLKTPNFIFSALVQSINRSIFLLQQKQTTANAVSIAASTYKVR